MVGRGYLVGIPVSSHLAVDELEFVTDSPHPPPPSHLGSDPAKNSAILGAAATTREPASGDGHHGRALPLGRPDAGTGVHGVVTCAAAAGRGQRQDRLERACSHVPGEFSQAEVERRTWVRCARQARRPYVMREK